ncbi:four-carbon acid sugar kinase family protein [Diplocloster agilis]|uniref:Hydroxyacid dehydrogenase n=1 Tax=Diplocloster agilis TaxID=2850323 RepID=A0A949JZJ2_9FIRM|nr:four-carbon acid sugar kinase family protein [Diplocloster agilis]MBU9737474.1 hydroxyacid dehydrogenase [Diplocloster agilis]
MGEEREVQSFLKYKYPKDREEKVSSLLNQLIRENDRMLAVIDDDPTGGQTVHDINVYTNWNRKILLKAFQTPQNMFYIMTNSRSMTRAETAAVQKEIMENLVWASKETGRRFEVISRGDSTLRGHYPLETQVLAAGLPQADRKELLIPYFHEGKRYTINDIHYLQDEERLIPVGSSEFSKDKAFGYESSNLKNWIEEKTEGNVTADRVGSITLEMLRNLEFDRINAVVSDNRYSKVIINAATDMDLKVFAVCYYQMLKKGMNFIVRSASSWPKIVSGISSVPLMEAGRIVDKSNRNGGLVIVGSHVMRTTEQLNSLMESKAGLRFIEFNQHTALEPAKLAQETQKVVDVAQAAMASGVTAVIYTRRERLDWNKGSAEEELAVTNRIADAVTGIAARIRVNPRFVVVKGGITSSDIAVKAYQVTEGKILGQVAEGVPVWRLGADSRYPGMAYVIFPGNVGDKDTLRNVVEALIEH